LGKGRKHFSNHFDMLRQSNFLLVSQLKQVFLEADLLIIVVTVAVGRGKAVVGVRQNAEVLFILLIAHNNNFY
jgi:hypothetical protein